MNIRLQQFNRLLNGSDPLRDMLERLQIAETGTYVDFARRLYRDLDKIVFRMHTDRHLRQKDSEDRLTIDILLQLRPLGYEAEHDIQKGGHIDIDIEIGKFSWIGEAKKDGNYREGFKQLADRYVPSSGNYNHNHGGLIFYLVKRKNAAGILRTWEKELQKLGAAQTAACSENPLAMYSEHILTGSGTPYTVRTMFVSLYHKPTDSSGVQAAANAKRRTAVKKKTKP